MRRSLAMGICASLLACTFCVPALAAEEIDGGALPEPEEITFDGESDMTDADGWFTTDKETKDITTDLASEKAKAEQEAAAKAEKEAKEKAKAEQEAAAKAEKEAKRRAKKAKKQKQTERYVSLFSDSGYRYDLDTKNLRWVALPHSADEYIIDTWVKLTQEQADDGTDGTYTYPAKYYLAHYYVRPKTHQIQFLSELEVTGGRPDNTIKGRGYKSANWEDLTPDSIEDAIYEGAVAHMKERKDGDATRGKQSLWEQAGDLLHVYL